MTESTIYWITRLDEVKSFCTGFQIVFSVAVVLGVLLAIITYCMKMGIKAEGYRGYEESSDYKMVSSLCGFGCKIAIPAFILAVTCSLAGTLLPTTKEMIAIKVIPQIVDTESAGKIKNISKDMIDVAADWLDEMRRSRMAKKQENQLNQQ